MVACSLHVNAITREHLLFFSLRMNWKSLVVDDYGVNDAWALKLNITILTRSTFIESMRLLKWPCIVGINCSAFYKCTHPRNMTKENKIYWVSSSVSMWFFVEKIVLAFITAASLNAPFLFALHCFGQEKKRKKKIKIYQEVHRNSTDQPQASRRTHTHRPGPVW